MRISIPRFSVRFTTPLPPVRPSHDVLLTGVTDAIRARQLDVAESALRVLIDDGSADAAALNLLGAVFELRGDWQAARKQYGRATKFDSTYEPAQQNLRRWYELFTFGRAQEPLALHNALIFR